METIHTTIGFDNTYSIIPDTLKNLPGYSAKSKSYTVLKGNHQLTETSSRKYRPMEELKHEPSYMGYITIENPGNIVSYEYDGELGLDYITLTELVDVIKHNEMIQNIEACS